MIAIERIDVRQPILNSPEFGQNELASVERALQAGQTSDVRQALQELAARANSDRDHLACGIIAYLLARRDEAVSHLSRVQGSGIAAYYLALTLLSQEKFSAASEQFEQAKNSVMTGFNAN